MALLKKFQKDTVDVRVYDTNECMGQAVADEVEKAIQTLFNEKEEISIIFSAAPSQFTTFDALKKKKSIDWSRITMFHVDEVAGLAKDDPTNLRNYIEHWFSKDLPFKQKFFFDTTARDLTAECRRYAKLLEEYDPDIAILGFGDNGHIALDEPGISPFNDPEIVKVVRQHEMTMHQSMAPGGGRVARKEGREFGYTITLPVLMKVRYKFFAVPTDAKADAARRAIFGEISEDCPASIIRLHQGVIACFNADSAKYFDQEL